MAEIKQGSLVRHTNSEMNIDLGIGMVLEIDYGDDEAAVRFSGYEYYSVRDNHKYEIGDLRLVQVKEVSSVDKPVSYATNPTNPVNQAQTVKTSEYYPEGAIVSEVEKQQILVEMRQALNQKLGD